VVKTFKARVMAHKFIENNGEKSRVYDSLIVEPKKLNIFGSDLAIKVVQELAVNPGCAMDLSRSLNEHEQKIYYHLRRLEEAGIIKKIRTEKRYAMTAKIYALVSPVVSAKLHHAGYEEVNDEMKKPSPALENFFHPFVRNGNFDGKIIIGDPYPHGEYEEGERCIGYATDFMLLLGNVVGNTGPSKYKIDIDVKENELKDNLIVIGNPRSNTVFQALLKDLPVEFNKEASWSFVSKTTNKIYKDPRIGMIIKCDNPFDKSKKIFILGSLRSKGMRSASIAVTRHLEEIVKSADKDGNIVKIVEGLDKDGDGIIDSVRILE